MPPATNHRDNLRHQRPSPPIQKASRRTKRDAHWLPAPPLLCKPPPHSASLQVVPPPSRPFWTALSLLPSLIGCCTCRSELGCLPLAVGRFLGRRTGRSAGWGAPCADWPPAGFERCQRPGRKGPDGAVGVTGAARRAEARPGSGQGRPRGGEPLLQLPGGRTETAGNGPRPVRGGSSRGSAPLSPPGLPAAAPRAASPSRASALPRTLVCIIIPFIGKEGKEVTGENVTGQDESQSADSAAPTPTQINYNKCFTVLPFTIFSKTF